MHILVAVIFMCILDAVIFMHTICCNIHAYVYIYILDAVIFMHIFSPTPVEYPPLANVT